MTWIRFIKPLSLHSQNPLNRQGTMTSISAPKGTKDLYTPEIAKWQYLEEKIRTYFSHFFYREIRTPIFEHSELFQRGIGSETEVVQKEMYTFNDKGGRSITLRPENTAPVVRSVIEKNLIHETFPLRFYYIGPMFRYEKPQKGRFRQFHQFGVEVFGDMNPALDAEIVYSAFDFLHHLGLKKLELYLNSVGCKQCRPPFLARLQAEAGKNMDALCSDCQRKAAKNPLRIFDCKVKSCGEISSRFPVITDHLCGECSDHFDAVKKTLSLLDIKFTLNPRLVRGLDYYTKTAFEIVSAQLGAQDAVLGGGRYDDLSQQLGGPPFAGIGFAAGMERIILHLEEISEKEKARVYVTYQNADIQTEAIKLIKELWESGITAMMDYSFRNLKKQFKRADRVNADFTIVLGEDELSSDEITVKEMNTQQQHKIKRGDLIEWIKQA